MMVGQQLNWRNVVLCCALLTGSTGGVLLTNHVTESNTTAIAQPLPSSTNLNNFLQGLYQFNLTFLTAKTQLNSLTTELAALDQRQKSFDAQFFKDYSRQVQTLQQQLAVLETQLGGFTTSQQQLAVKAEIENLQVTSQNLLKLSQPFEAGFNQESIRTVQEFLNFFKRRNLTEANYGFYGSVTQTEMQSYVERQLTNFSDGLKRLNETATQAAIAPDLETSVSYLYTNLSLNQASGSSNLQTTITQLQADNQALQQRLENTHRMILFLPLVVMLPTTILVFILFYYFGRIFQEKVEQAPAYQFSINDIYGLEDELIARLAQKYELKPKLIKTPHDAFTNKLITLATTELEPDTTTTTATTTIEAQKDQTEEKFAELNSVMDGEIDATEAEDFPVHIPNIYDELVEVYNEDARQFQAEAIALSISHQESYLDDESEFTPLLLLNQDETGDYWATVYKSLEYLVPKANFSVTADNYQTFKNIFICYGYQHNTVQKVKLLKPARVSPTTEANTWELVQQGIVVLHCI